MRATSCSMIGRHPELQLRNGRSAMQCRYCEQKSAMRGRWEVALNFRRMASSAASGANACSNAARWKPGLFVAPIQAPFDAHEEQAQLVVLVLVGMQNVCTMLVEQPRNAGHESFAIRAIDEQNSGVFHSFFRGSDRIASLDARPC
jgi:hypothetical protein